MLRRYAHEVAAAFEDCAAELEHAWQRNQQDFLPLSEAAAYSGYSQDHLRRLARNGQLPAVRQGRRLYFTIGSLPVRPTRRFDGTGRSEYDVHADARQVIARRSRGGSHETQEVANLEG